MVAIIQPKFNFWWGTQLLVAAIIFASLCWLVSRSRRFNEYETRLQQRLIRQQSNWWWHVIAVVFDPKTMVFWNFCLAGVLLFIGRWPRAIFVLACLGTVDAFGILVKHQIRRSRPADFVKATTTYSFPSGHTLGTTMMALIMTMLFPGWWQWLILLCWLLVIYCRLTLRAHYPADIVAAIALAYSWWIGAEWIYNLLMR